jgi:hypothetical protein
MRRAPLAAALLVLLLAAGPARASCDPAAAASAEAALREALRLWKDRRYEALHERGWLEQQAAIPREDFVRLMRREDRVPQCCWLALRHVRSACDGADVYLAATVGYEVSGYLFDAARRAWVHDRAARDLEEVWRLGWQADAWRIDLLQLLGPSWFYYEKQPGIVRRFDFPRFPRVEPRGAERGAGRGDRPGR